MAKLEGGTNMVVVDPTYSTTLGAICHQGGDYMSRHIAASNALEECKVGIKPPSTIVLSQAEPNPFKFSIETDLRSHCVRGYMSSFSQGGINFHKLESLQASTGCELSRIFSSFSLPLALIRVYLG